MSIHTVVVIGRVLNVNIIERRVTRFLKIYILSIFRGIYRNLSLSRTVFWFVRVYLKRSTNGIC